MATSVGGLLAGMGVGGIYWTAMRKVVFQGMIMGKKFNLLFPYLGLIGMAGFVMILWITPRGPGIQPDSIVYLNGAKSLLAGKGFLNHGIPITHFPPLYSLTLAATNLAANNLLRAVRFLNAVLFGTNLVLAALGVYFSTERSWLTTTCAVIFFLASAPLVAIHAWALTEPLFITLTLVFVLLLSMYVNRPTLFLLIASALALGLAIITRYIGLAFIPAGLLIVFFGKQDQRLRRRFRDVLIWALPACAPLAILSIINKLSAGSTSDRSFVYHPISELQYLGGIIDNGLKFIAPVSLPAWVWPAFFGLLAGLLIGRLGLFSILHPKEIHWRSMGFLVPATCFMMLASYLFILYLSLSFFDASTPLDSRLLSPIFLLLMAGGFPAAWNLARYLKKPVLWWSFLALIALSISMKTIDAIRSAESIRENGLGFTSTQWRQSESIMFVNSLGKDAKIYSNGADILGFLTGRQALSVPREKSPTTLIPNPDYTEELGIMCNDIVDNGAFLVYFNMLGRTYIPTQEEVKSACHLSVLENLADGKVYGLK
jgi:hypothetical protein